MKIIPLTLLGGSLFFAASAPAAYVNQDFGFFGSTYDGTSIIGNRKLGTLHLVYNDSIPLITQDFGIWDLKFNYIPEGFSQTFVKDGIGAPETTFFTFSFSPLNSREAFLRYSTQNGLNFQAHQTLGVTTIVYMDTPNILGDYNLGSGRIRAIGVPDSGHTAALLLGSLAWMGWKRRKHGHKSIG